MPVGPMSSLCIRRTLLDGRAMGLAVGAGIAAGDALYAAVAAFGLTAVYRALVAARTPLTVTAGVALIAIGVAGILAQPVDLTGRDGVRRATANPRRAGAAFASSLLLTLGNPATIGVFLAIFAVLGTLPGTVDPVRSALVVAGAFLGSLAWWVVLTSLVSHLRSRLGNRGLRVVNVAFGTLILAFGVVAIVALAFHRA
jgi:putative LysE/RhtB family amino acid efflux pump